MKKLVFATALCALLALPAFGADAPAKPAAAQDAQIEAPAPIFLHLFPMWVQTLQGMQVESPTLEENTAGVENRRADSTVEVAPMCTTIYTEPGLGFNCGPCVYRCRCNLTNCVLIDDGGCLACPGYN